MSARWSVGEGRPMCQAVGCRQLAAPVAVEVVLPFYGGVELGLEVCPERREVVERAVAAVGEVVFQAGWTWPRPALWLGGRVSRHEVDGDRGAGAAERRAGRSPGRAGSEGWSEELT